MQLRSQQRGAGLLKLVFMFGLLAIVATIGLKSYPLYVNEMKLSQAVRGVASERPGDPATMRSVLQRRYDMEDITFPTTKDILMLRDKNNQFVLSYDYESRVHLFYNADLVLSFKGSYPVASTE